MIMTEWSIFDVTFSNGQQSCHLVGHVVSKSRRVSSAIKNFAPETKTIITRNDQIYRLAGRPRTNYNGDDIWEKWRELHNVSTYQNITHEYE